MHLFRNDNNKAKSRRSRVLSVALSAALALGSFSVMAMADSNTAIKSVENKANTVVLAGNEEVPTVEPPEPTPMPDTTVASGTCGDNHTWKLDENGTLTISGTGAMPVAGVSGVAWYEWYEHKDSITSVVIDSGVTTIGKYTFTGYENLKSVWIADGVTSIGLSAFARCGNLTMVNIPTSVNYVDANAFEACSSLSEICFPCTGRLDFSDQVFISRTNKLSVLVLAKTVTFLYADCFGSSESDVFLPNVTSLLVDYDGQSIVSNTTYHVKPSQYSSLQNTFPVAYLPDASVGTLAGDLCGDYAYFTMNGTELQVKGSGEMYDFTYSSASSAPWGSVATSAETITIAEGITSIGKNAFAGCANVTSVTIPSSVSSIGLGAFKGCSSVETVICNASADMTWNCGTNEFKANRATDCEVAPEYLTDFKIEHADVNLKFTSGSNSSSLGIGVASTGSDFYIVVQLPEHLNGDEVTYEDYVVLIDNDELEESKYIENGQFPIKCAVSDMTRLFNLSVFDKRMNDYIYNSSVSVAKYLKYVSVADNMEAYHDTAKAMLRYGAAAQMYFDVDTSNLANAGIEGYGLDSLATTDFSFTTYEGNEFNTNLNLTYSEYAGITLRFGTSLDFYMFFKVHDDVQDISLAEKEISDKASSQVVVKSNSGFVYIHGVTNIKNLNSVLFSFPIGTNGTLGISAYDYIEKVLQKTEPEYENLQILCKGLYELFKVAKDV